MGKVWPETELVSFRWRDDDGSESAATWLELINTNTTIDVTSGTQEVRLRFLIRENNGASETVNANLYVSKNGGAYTTLASSDLTYFDSTNLTNDGDTTQQLGSGTYVSNNNWVCEDGVGSGTSLNSNEAEIEYTIQFPGTLIDSDYYDFQAYDSTSAMDVVTNTARATISNDNKNITTTLDELALEDTNRGVYVHRGVLEDPTQDYFHRFCSQPSGVTLIYGTGGWSVNTTTCMGSVTGSSDLQYTIDGTWEDEQYAETFLGTIISGDADLVRIGVRVTDGTTDWTGYILEVDESANPSTVRLYRYDDGSKTELDSANSFSTSTNGNNHLSIKVEGTNIRTYLDFVQQHNATDSNYSSGSPSYGIKEASGGSAPQIKYILAEAKAGSADTNIDATLDALTLTENEQNVVFDVFGTSDTVYQNQFSTDPTDLTYYNGSSANHDVSNGNLDSTGTFWLAGINGTWENDQFVETYVSTFGAGSNVYLGVRLADGVSYWYGYVLKADATDNTTYLWRYDDNSPTELDSTNNFVTSQGDTLAIKCVGNTITTYQNGVQRHSVTDTTYTTGTPGYGGWRETTDTAIDYITALTIAGETNISAGVDALTLTKYNVTVNAETSFTTTLDSLTLTDYSITHELNVKPTYDALTLTDYNATTAFDSGVNATLDQLTLTTYNVSIQAGENVNISADYDALVLTDLNPTVNAETSFTTTLDQLTLTAYNTTVQLTVGTNINVDYQVINLTEYKATITGAAEPESSGSVGGYYKPLRDLSYYEERVKELLKEEREEKEEIEELKEELVEKETIVIIEEDDELKSLKTEREIIAAKVAITSIKNQIIESQQELLRIQAELAEAQRLQAILKDDEEFLAHYIMVS